MLYNRHFLWGGILMNFRELQYIVAIAEEGGVTRAADKLYVSQPTLSRFLQQHEQTLGAQIFQRVNGKMVPTFFGEQYLKYARRILHLGDQMDLELSDIVHQDKGRLRIASPKHRADGVILLSIMRFHERFPNVEIKVIEETSEKREAALQRGDVDLALIFPPRRDPALVYEPVLEEQVLLCAPPNWPRAAEAVGTGAGEHPLIDLRATAGEKFVLQPATSITGRIARSALSNAGITPHIIVESTSLSGILTVVSKGYALGFLPSSYVRAAVTHTPVKTFSIGEFNSSMVLTAAYNANVYQPKYARDYIQILREVIREEFGTNSL